MAPLCTLQSRPEFIGFVRWRAPFPTNKSTPTDFGKLIADETEKWGKAIRAANIKPQG